MNLIFRFLSVAALCLCLSSCSDNTSIDTDLPLSIRKAPNMTAKLYFPDESIVDISLIRFSAQPIDQNTFTFIKYTGGLAASYTVSKVEISEPDDALELIINNTEYTNKSGVTILPKTSTSIESKVSPDDVIFTSPNIVGEENDEL